MQLPELSILDAYGASVLNVSVVPPTLIANARAFLVQAVPSINCELALMCILARSAPRS
jgi:hypothetical protein